mgnify:CR=1 FL=1
MKDAAGVKNVLQVLQGEGTAEKLVVVSAMGKITNALEEVVKDYLQKESSEVQGVFLGTAHPAKFWEVVEPLIGDKVELPGPLKQALNKPSQSQKMSADFNEFKEYLLKVVAI